MVLSQRALLLVDTRKSLSNWVKTPPMNKPLKLVPFTTPLLLSAFCTKLDYHDLLRLTCNIWPRNKSPAVTGGNMQLVVQQVTRTSKQTHSTRLEVPTFLLVFWYLDCSLVYWTNKKKEVSILPHLLPQNRKRIGWLTVSAKYPK